MFTFIRKLQVAALILPISFLVGCGEDGVDLADHISLSVDNELRTADVGFALNDGVEMNFDGRIPVYYEDGIEYAAVTFAPMGWEDPAQIIIHLNWGAILDHADLPIEVGLAETLPNNSRFPRAVVPPLYYIGLGDMDGFEPYLYIGIENYLQLGAAVLIDAIGTRFPPGLVLSQNFRNDKGQLVGAASIFGPLVDEDGYVMVSGGLYLHGNFGGAPGSVDLGNDPIVIGAGEAASPIRASSSLHGPASTNLRTLQKFGTSKIETMFESEIIDPFKKAPRSAFEADRLERDLKRVIRNIR